MARVKSREGVPMREFDGAMVVGSWQWSLKGVAALGLGGCMGCSLTDARRRRYAVEGCSNYGK